MAGYKGFLYIKCRKCGKERAYCSKISITQHHCTCGAVTPFVEPLRVMYVMCECGHKTCRYKTNMTGKMFDVPCIKCQAPVAVEWDAKRQQYKTVIN
ncbi:hypothetical protein [Lacrimispora sp.]|uniref:hypothetical protein n=1 Tax=Lacrimispora sp. TaxID=2719234 RepID=UPI0034612D23